MGECDETVAGQASLPEMDRWQGRPHRLLDGKAVRHFNCMKSQKTHATDVEPAKTRRNSKPFPCATPFEIHDHLSKTQRGNWLAGQTRPDPSCQISSAQQCMPSATVEQIRRANARVRRGHQLPDLKLTFLSIPPEKLRFVTHSDNSSKDQDGTGRTQGGYVDRPVNESWTRGAVVAAGVTVAQAETRMHVNIGPRGQSFEFGIGTLGVGHVHACHCFVRCILFGKQGRTSSDSQPSVSSTAKVCFTL